ERKNKSSASSRRQLQGLPLMRRNIAGIDLGSTAHWVCAPTADGSGREIADFGATTPELIRMAEWLKERKVESVALESTGVYWIAPHEVLEAQGLEVLLVDTGNWRKYLGATRRQIRRTANGFNACIVADCYGDRSDPRNRYACYGR